LGAISDGWRTRRNSVSVLSGKQRTISPIPCRPNFTKFEHNASIGVATKTFGTEFYRKGSFFQKRKIFSKIFNALRFLSAVTPKLLQIAGYSLRQ